MLQSWSMDIHGILVGFNTKTFEYMNMENLEKYGTIWHGYDNKKYSK